MSIAVPPNSSMTGNAVTTAGFKSGIDTILAIMREWNGRWYGVLVADPTLDPNGAAITPGDVYFNSVSENLMVYVSGGWVPIAADGVAVNAAAAALADRLLSDDNAAQTAADRVQTSSDVVSCSAFAAGALAAGNLYADTASALAATVSGDAFLVVTGDPQIYDVYTNNAGAAVLSGTYLIDASTLTYGDNFDGALYGVGRNHIIGVPPSESGLLYKVRIRFAKAATLILYRMHKVGTTYIKDSQQNVTAAAAGVVEVIFANPIEIGTDVYLAIETPTGGAVAHTPGGTRDLTFLGSMQYTAIGSVTATEGVSQVGNLQVAVEYFVTSKQDYLYYKTLKNTATQLRSEFDSDVLSSNSRASRNASTDDLRGAAGIVVTSYPRTESLVDGVAYSMLIDNWKPLMVPALSAHVDTVAGNNANSGSRTAPRATLPALVADGKYGFKGGSTIVEQVTSALQGLSFVGYSGQPVWDGAGPVAEVWYQTDAVTYPKVWEIDVTHGFTITSGGIQIWEDGVMLLRVASLSVCNTTPGSYYSPNWHAYTVPTVKMYVHPVVSTNPLTDGKLYERTQRENNISIAYGPATKQSVSNIIAGRQYSNDGSIVLGKDSLIDRCLCFDGHKHNALQESGLCQNSVFVDAQYEINYLHVFYMGDATGSVCVWRNCIFIGNVRGQSTALSSNAIYNHDNAGLGHDSALIENCVMKDVRSALASTAVSFTARGVYIDNCENFTDAIAASSITVSHCILNKQGHFSTVSSSGIFNLSQNCMTVDGAYLFYDLFANWGTRNIDHNTFNFDTHPSSSAVFTRVAGSGTVNITNNIILALCESSAGKTLFVGTAATTGTIDNNVYYCHSTSGRTKADFRWTLDGVSHDFAAWQALGYDLNSVVLDESDITLPYLLAGDISAGDFRLKPRLSLALPDGTPIDTLGATEHWDFNAQKIMPGPANRFPIYPVNYTEGVKFIQDPEAWGF